MANLRITSLNVKGFNIPERRSQILYHMHKLKSHILCLQETHFKLSNVPTFRNRYYPVWCHSSSSLGKTKGVAIFFHKSLPCEILEVKTDVDARSVFVKCNIQGTVYTIANIYAPNQGQIPFLHKTFDDLTTFMQGQLILCGDFNLVLQPSIDTSSGRSSLALSKINKVKRLLHSLQLCDAWRLLHPQERDYSFFFSPSRLL